MDPKDAPLIWGQIYHWDRKWPKKRFSGRFQVPSPKKASEGPKKGQKSVFSKYLENWWKFIFLTPHPVKLIKFLRFKKKIHQNRTNGLDFRAFRSRKSVSRGQNFDFWMALILIFEWPYVENVHNAIKVQGNFFYMTMPLLVLWSCWKNSLENPKCHIGQSHFSCSDAAVTHIFSTYGAIEETFKIAF